MNAILRITGRICFALIFIMSGIQKLQTFEFGTGGPVMDVMEPKMNLLLEKIQQHANITFEDSHIEMARANYKWMLLLAALMETIGGVLFIFDISFGAYLLLLFTITVTPIIHNFFDLPPSYEQMLEMVNFFKNVTIVGGLLFYLGLKGSNLQLKKQLMDKPLSFKKNQ
eukprot:TRINITY_DN1265_c0_g1_i1.p3 TRINITY_DN1265_c0_g1~~TRINITY_DN1265_c0_g1_i1.p3  ORF type:complete len:189 (+),score=16.84 TRINITY_DN1265_c0_g1_i1:61-567(+)